MSPALVSPLNLSQSRERCVAVEMGRRAAKIALRKGKADAKKAKIYGKIGKKIIQVVKAGGPDPGSNSKLHDLLKQARELGVPKDIIERNVKRASDKSQADYQEVTYEAYGPAGTGFIIDCLTDNLNRTASEVKAAITKSGCKVAEPGSVMFLFTRAGQVLVENSTEDAVFEAAMEAGADDVAPGPPGEDGGPSTSYKVFTSVEGLVGARAKLAQLGFAVNVEESDLVYKPNALVDVDDDAFAKCEALVERLLELDDVDGVYANVDGLDI
eukprot:CAMPEP_0202859040 /NCGR_PEP_ID=MMETSP1391-20130828/1330_1 /ASSEMBLY_ACC=CAM_ASM_000867 /TAXON_ID=1034604 /ORGANISM="Chlamydomonas leiostraca, Strain SAG 11-49" /LENGTH=269 /DNA_ID=CAMNT_0049538041 /DNA_START=62 /DNA_END=871 /DNA_ORIENTATION=-